MKKSQQIEKLFTDYVVPTYARSLTLVKGKGSYVWDADGRKYLDFCGGIAVNVLGHAHPAIARALKNQSTKLVHVSNLYYTEPQGNLAKEIVKLTGLGKVFFCNSGAEANETLYKLARKFGRDSGKYEIITALNSFHGRTLGGIAATGQEKIKKGFEPIMSGFVHVPFNDLSAFEKAITPQTAAILIEGIQGEGGIIPATKEFLLGLRKLTHERNILLLMDAVQDGFFRTGNFQSYQTILGKEAFQPDAVAMAKGLGGGFPIGAAWIAKKYADVLQPGSHGSTFGGTPLACAVSLAVIDTIKKQKLAQNIRKQGARLIKGLEKLKKSKDNIVEVRGYGGMIGLQISGKVKNIIPRLAQHGLLLVPAGEHTIRFLPPLNVRLSEIDSALQIVKNHL